MALLLDTHVVLWWRAGEQLSREAHQAIADPAQPAWVSAATIWEASIKTAASKLRVDGGFLAGLEAAGFDVLSISGPHAEAAGALPPHHRDPFDRMLVAQAQLEDLTLVTRDPVFGRYDVRLLRA